MIGGLVPTKQWWAAIGHYIRNEDDKVPSADRFNPGQKLLFWGFFVERHLAASAYGTDSLVHRSTFPGTCVLLRLDRRVRPSRVLRC
jgi:hypothetical protein